MQALGLLTRRLAEPKRPRPLMRAETAAEVSPQVEAGVWGPAEQSPFSLSCWRLPAQRPAERSKASLPSCQSLRKTLQISIPVVEVRAVLSELTGRRPVPAPEKIFDWNTD